MNKLESALRKCRKFYQTYEKQVKIAVIALVVITALVLFGAGGKKGEIVVEQPGETAVTENAIAAETEPKSLIVDISGCVKCPGVYEVEEDTRLHQVIELAGGLTKEADINAINQAESVMDGQKVYIPSVEESLSTTVTGSAAISPQGRININYADAIQLQEIPGVGEVTAEKIVAYRESNGRFERIEEIKNVSGIGEKTFEKMKDKICI